MFFFLLQISEIWFCLIWGWSLYGCNPQSGPVVCFQAEKSARIDRPFYGSQWNLPPSVLRSQCPVSSIGYWIISDLLWQQMVSSGVYSVNSSQDSMRRKKKKKSLLYFYRGSAFICWFQQRANDKRSSLTPYDSIIIQILKKALTHPWKYAAYVCKQITHLYLLLHISLPPSFLINTNYKHAYKQTLVWPHTSTLQTYWYQRIDFSTSCLHIKACYDSWFSISLLYVRWACTFFFFPHYWWYYLWRKHSGVLVRGQMTFPGQSVSLNMKETCVCACSNIFWRRGSTDTWDSVRDVQSDATEQKKIKRRLAGSACHKGGPKNKQTVVAAAERNALKVNDPTNSTVLYCSA